MDADYLRELDEAYARGRQIAFEQFFNRIMIGLDEEGNMTEQACAINTDPATGLTVVMRFGEKIAEFNMFDVVQFYSGVFE